MQLRPAVALDALAIAALQAASWRHAYRGALSDEYLDRRVMADRSAVWGERLNAANERQYVVVAEEHDRLTGFACAYANEHSEWGSLLDNIHVSQAFQRAGIGSLLMRNVAAWCVAVTRETPIYLWVFENNTAALEFYRKLGAQELGRDLWVPPGGGIVRRRRIAWPDSHTLLRRGG
jgi:ribosomal protein S18 acetylase RimI-like enzyme